MTNLFYFTLYVLFYGYNASPCDGIPGGTTVGEKCVWLSPVLDKNVHESRAYCDSVKQGSDLIVIDSQEKATLVHNLITGAPGDSTWLGIEDRDSSLCRDWRWFDGRKVDAFQTWVIGQPNGLSQVNPGAGVQNCVTVKQGSGVNGEYGWNDQTCTNPKPRALCECCSDQNMNVEVARYRRNGQSTGQDKGQLLPCAVQCKTDRSCCSYWYNPDTQQCEYNTPDAMTKGFTREHAGLP